MKKILLQELLRKYFRGKAYTEDSEKAMPSLSEPEIDRIFSGKTTFEHYGGKNPEYNDPAFVRTVNSELEDLERLGFVSLKRDRKNEDLYERVYLQKGKVPEACKYAGYERIDLIEKELLEVLERYKDSESIGPAVRIMMDAVHAHKDLAAARFGGKKDPRHLDAVLKAAQGIMEQEKEIYLRNLSVLLFHHSKALESVLKQACDVIAMTSDDFAGLEKSTDVLEYFNVLRNPTYVYFRGSGSIVFDNGIEYRLFGNAVGICSSDLGRIKGIRIEDERVLTIENLTTFNSEDEPAFLIYLGGYHNTARKEILQKIYRYNPNKEYRHFGDIDAGGFYIFRRLKADTGIPFTTYRMDIRTLKENAEYWKNLTEGDAKRLKCILGRDDMWEFHETAAYMLEHKCKLEQESLSLVPC